MQLEGGISCRMGQIKSRYRTYFMSRLGDGFDVEKLPRVILDSSHVDHSQGTALIFDFCHDILGPQGVFSRSRLKLHQHLFGI